MSTHGLVIKYQVVTMVIPNGSNSIIKKTEKRTQRSLSTSNESFQDNLRNSVHSSDGSLQISDDEADNEAVATTRLNTWLNGGSNETPLQLGAGTIVSTTPVNPFIVSNNLPSPFSVKPPSTRYTTTSLQVDVPDISIGFNETSERSRKPPSPPKTIGTSNIKFPNSVPVHPGEMTTPGSSVFFDSADPRKNDKNADLAKKETIHGESFKFSNLNGSTPNSIVDQALTNMPPKPHHQHHRSVSWGEKETAIPTKAPKLSPKLSPVPSRHNRGPSEFSLFSVLTQSDSEGGSPRNVRSDSSRVNMDELLRMNPLETEAETLIIKVIEAQEVNARNRANTGHSAILENIPDDSAHIFMPQIETVSSKSSAAGTVKGNRPTFDMDERQGINPSNRPHSATVDLGPPSAPTATSNMASSAPSGAAPIQSNQRPPRPNLARNLTVEHKLANLTEALAGYHNKTGESTFASNKLNQRTEIEEVHNADVSAGEKLAKNASLIYRGRQKTDGKKTENVQGDKISDGDHGATKTSNWPKVRAVTYATKPKTTETTNQNAAAIPNTSNHHISMASGSVEERKKTDLVSEDVEQGYPDVAIDYVTAASHTDENRMKLNESVTNGKTSKSWRVFHKVPIINSKAARDFRSFAGQRRSDLFDYLRFMVVVVFPALATAVILFYFAGM